MVFTFVILSANVGSNCDVSLPSTKLKKCIILSQPYPRNDDASHTISVTFLGKSMDSRPEVLSPIRSYSTDNPYASFNGNSDRNAKLYVYNGDSLVGQFNASNNGKWELNDLKLDDGYNSIMATFKCYKNHIRKQAKSFVFVKMALQKAGKLQKLKKHQLLSGSTFECFFAGLLFLKFMCRETRTNGIYARNSCALYAHVLASLTDIDINKHQYIQTYLIGYLAPHPAVV